MANDYILKMFRCSAITPYKICIIQKWLGYFSSQGKYLSGVPVLTLGKFIILVLQERGDSGEENKWAKERHVAVCYVMTNWTQHRHAGTMKWNTG